MARVLHIAACAALIALVFLCVAWEAWLAPLRAGGSWLVLKALPLVAPLAGVVRARRYTLQWSALLVLAYLAEGLVRIASEAGARAALAGVEIALALGYFAAVFGYLALTGGKSK